MIQKYEISASLFCRSGLGKFQCLDGRKNFQEIAFAKVKPCCGLHQHFVYRKNTAEMLRKLTCRKILDLIAGTVYSLAPHLLQNRASASCPCNPQAGHLRSSLSACRPMEAAMDMNPVGTTIRL